MYPPVFSLIHPTARLKNGGLTWMRACSRWRSTCGSWSNCEYVLSIHRRQAELPNSGPEFDFGVAYRAALASLNFIWERYILAVNVLAPTMVNNGNCAALASTVKVLVDVNDDLEPCTQWDLLLLEAIAKAGKTLNDEFVIKVSHGTYQPDLITHPIVSRAYFERIGPTDPRYIGYGCDDELTEMAYRDGVVIDATHIVFEHRHPSMGTRVGDALDAHNGRPEVWANKEEIRAARRAAGFPKVELR